MPHATETRAQYAYSAQYGNETVQGSVALRATTNDERKCHSAMHVRQKRHRSVGARFECNCTKNTAKRET